jgi:predicted nuclease with TOPRIM domain
MTSLLEVKAGEAPPLVDMCPKLPEEISSLEPKFTEYVTAKAEELEKFDKQYSQYTKARDAFESKFSVELKKVESDWAKLQENQFPSQKRFYNLLAKNNEDEGLLNEVKSVCWIEVMGIDEFEKDNLCNTLEKPPSSTEWNKILVCTMKRADLLKITLFQ